MGLEIKQDLRLSQQLILVPQLQLSLKLLQMPRIELEEYLKAELETNPALEEITYQENRLKSAENGTAQEAGPTESSLSSDAARIDSAITAPPEDAYDGQPDAPPAPETPRSDGSDDMYLENVLKDSDVRIQDFTSRAERPSFENVTSGLTNLVDHLLWQLSLQKISGAVAAAAVLIIGNLDDNGYLGDSLESLAGMNQIDIKTMEEALRAVQALDPAGVGARDLKECLTIQVSQLGLGGATLFRVIQDGLEFVGRSDPKGLAKALDLSMREATNAIKTIKGLNPKPGRNHSTEEAPFVTPDLAIVKVGNEYEIILNNDTLPSLVINPTYRTLAQRRDLDDKEKAYVKERIRAALWLIKSIDQRQKTIYKVTTALVKFQRDFLDHGITFLKPLTLRDVAREVGVHESTVSRVTSNKWVDTSHGLMRLKDFFSTGMTTRQGTHISTESIKHDFMVLVGNENKRRPLSDMEIAKHLRAKGIDISRRTVAKYREQAEVPPAFQRKQR